MWDYNEAFSRNLGLISSKEQEILRNSRVAIAGMGGVGGAHLITMARLGINQFTIADSDSFEVANFNRQYGATTPNVGHNKAEVMAREARKINPEIDIRIFSEPVTANNVDNFLTDVDVVVDGIDFFNIKDRRMLFCEARNKGLWAVTVGPIGFGTAWITFSPNKMTFDRYFDLRDSMSHLDQLIAFAVGLTPRAFHLKYMDLTKLDHTTGVAPSVGLACNLASGVLATEVCKILLGHTPLYTAPYVCQFDARYYKFSVTKRNYWVRKIMRYIVKKAVN